MPSTAPRVPPYSAEAEAAVIGALLLRPELLGDVLDTGLGDADFYSPKWSAAFAVIADLVKAGEAVDVLTVDRRLGEVRPTMAEMIDATADVPATGHATAYAKAVVDTARLRRFIAAGTEWVNGAFSQEAGNNAGVFLDAAAGALLAACQASHADDDSRWLGDCAADALADLRRQVDGDPAGVLSGFVDLDSLLGGLRPGQLVVLGARPGMGKSALALDVAQSVAGMGGPVLVCEAEMSGVELGMRALAAGGVNSGRLASGRLDEIDFQRLETRLEALRGLPVLINDRPSPTLLSIRSRARKMAAGGGLSLVIVDYLQLMEGARQERRELDVAAFSRGLKALAKELGVPVLALAQLNRGLEARSDKRPVLSDLRDSGQLEQDADVVLFLYRDEVYNPDSPDTGTAELIVAKHRNGPLGTVRLAFLSQQVRFCSRVGEGRF